MSEQLFAAFPRLSTQQALSILSDLIQVPFDELRSHSSAELDGASFYPMASNRIEFAALISIRELILSVAKSHGYPDPQPPTSRRSFDQELGPVLHASLRMLRAEAADDGVWSFLSLRLCPDVAFWRYPNKGLGEISAGEVDRFLGGVRHVFGRLWWRAEVLTPELSSQLLEDEAVGLMERPTIGGYLPLARSVASQQLQRVGALKGEKRQDIFREALKRLRREMGFISVYVLSQGDMDELVDRIFSAAVAAMTDASVSGNSWDPIGEFRRACGDHWPSVAPLVDLPRWGEVLAMREQAAGYLSDDPQKALQATRLASDLSQLLEQWHDWGADERSIVVAALKYFLLEEDSLPDDEAGGLDDDEQVVSAAFHAVRLERESADS